MFALALIFGVLLLSKVEAYTHEQETIAQFGVGSLGPGYTYQKIKNYRTQVTLLMFENGIVLRYIRNITNSKFKSVDKLHLCFMLKNTAK